MEYFKISNAISMVALLFVMTIIAVGWNSFEVRAVEKVAANPCINFDRWSPREVERHQFIGCVASRLGLNDYSAEDIQVTNEWHRNYGFTLAVKYIKSRASCSQSNDVWYLDRSSLEIVGFENEQIMCQTMFTD